MITRARIRAALFLLLSVLGSAAYLLQPPVLDGKTHVYMLNIGQGDSFLIVADDGRKMLIDGGLDTTILSELSKVLPSGDDTIDVVLATHPDADHIGGLQYVFQRYRVGMFLTADVGTDTKTYTDMYKQVLAEGIPAYYVRHGMMVSLAPNATFTVLFPDRDTSMWKTNEASVVGRLNVGSRSILFTGDSPSSVESFLVKAEPLELHADLLKLGHHGSKYSSSAEYLKAVAPTLGLVSAGVDNKYGHPNADVLGRLDAAVIPWVSTQQKGTVEFYTDGSAPWQWQSVE
ncbi:MAG: MBL fold metallo-hydrolase [Patescibacteria group bacterium]